MIDKTPEKQGVNKEFRRSEIVLWTVAIGAVIAITVIQVKKMLDSAEEKPQKPAAEAPEKVGEAAKKNNNRRTKQESSPQSSAQTFGALVENPASVFLKEPETVKEACDALKYGDPAYYSVYPALKLVTDSQKESPEDFSFVASFTLGDIGAECDLDSDELMEVLRAGIEQGDPEIGDIFKDVIAEKCGAEFRGSLDKRIIDGQREKSRREKCQQLPDSSYTDCLHRDSVQEKEKKCSRAFGENMKKCDDDNASSTCWMMANFESVDCRDQATQECKGLSFESPRMDCEFERDAEYRQKENEWIEECIARTMQQLNIDPDEVKMLADIKKAKSFVELYEEMTHLSEYSSEDEYRLLASHYVDDMQSLDFERPEILEALGVRNRQEFIDRYVSFFIDFVERKVMDGEYGYSSFGNGVLAVSSWSEVIEGVKVKFGL